MKNKIFLILLILIVINIYKITDERVIIPSSSIRLRVIPNSNEPKDIYMKEQVKNYLEENIYTLTKEIININDARNIIENNIPSIETNITNIFNDNNYQIPFKVNYGNNYFPEKVYKGITYEEGYYESLVISIGAANGDNWWCVLFPNFCLVDTKEKHEYKSYFKELFSSKK